MPRTKGPPRKSGAPGKAGAANRTRDLSFRAPLLARGQATFESILDATARLLQDSGIEAVTTNHVARAAGINVATLYHYFPNKQAILMALFERQTHRRALVARAALEALWPGAGWRRAIDAAIDAVVRLRRSEPGSAVLRLAMRSSPQLKSYDREDTQLVARVLAARIVADGATGPEEAEVAAYCCIETIGALLDAWQLDPNGPDERIVEQLKRMVERFLAPYFDRPGVAPDR